MVSGLGSNGTGLDRFSAMFRDLTDRVRKLEARRVGKWALGVDADSNLVAIDTLTGDSCQICPDDGGGGTGPAGPEGPAGATGATGATGPAGPAGPSGGTLTLVAGQDLSGERVVRPQLDGTLIYATNVDLDDANRALYFTLTAALMGDPVDVIALGEVVELGWSWSDGPIFLGVNGMLTQVPPAYPAANFIMQVASPQGTQALLFEPRTPIAFAF